MVANAYFIGAHKKGAHKNQVDDSISTTARTAHWELVHKSVLCMSGKCDIGSLEGELFLKKKTQTASREPNTSGNTLMFFFFY